MPAEPSAGVKVVKHMPKASEQLVPLKLPAPGETLQVTVPEGVLDVPLSVSATSATQEIGLFTGVVYAEQPMVTAVLRVLTVTAVSVADPA